MSLLPESESARACQTVIFPSRVWSCGAGLIEVVVSTLSEAALVYLDEEEEGRGGRKVSHLVLQGLLELLHNLLKQTSAVVRAALQVRARSSLKSAGLTDT